jgi:hypothetical protein
MDSNYFIEEDNSLKNETKINTLEKIQETLLNPDLDVSKDEIGPLIWAAHNNDITVLKQVLSDTRFNAPHKITAFLDTSPFKKNQSIEMVSTLLESIFSTEPRFQQYVFEHMVLKTAILDRSVNLITFLLNEPKYSPFLDKISEDSISRMYWFAIEADYAPPYHRHEISALLDTHFKFKPKAALISEYIDGREPHYIKPYLELYIHTEEEYLALIEILSQKNLLEFPDKNKTCAAEFILSDMEIKVKNDKKKDLPVRNFDKAIMAIFHCMEFKYKIECFNIANRISSISTIMEMATKLKSEITKIHNKELEEHLKSLKHYSRGVDFFREQNDETIKNHYREVIIKRLSLAEYEHIDPTVENKKFEQLIRLVDIFNDSRFLLDNNSIADSHKLKKRLYSLPKEARLDFIKESAKAGNRVFFSLISKIHFFNEQSEPEAGFIAWELNTDLKSNQDLLFEAICHAIETEDDNAEAAKLMIYKLNKKERENLLDYSIHNRKAIHHKTAKYLTHHYSDLIVSETDEKKLSEISLLHKKNVASNLYFAYESVSPTGMTIPLTEILPPKKKVDSINDKTNNGPNIP